MRKAAATALKLHKWLGLLAGAQLVTWLLSGLYMVAVDIDFIHGDPLVRNTQQALEPSLVPGITVSQLHQEYPAASEISLQPLLGRAVYGVVTPQARFMLDAANGETLAPLDEAAAREIARYHYNGTADVTGGTLITSDAPVEIRGRALPLWRIDFDDRLATSFYVDPTSGALVTRRHFYWRVFDVMWMLHIMDYRERDSVHHPLLIGAQVAGLLLFLSGVWVLIYRLANMAGRTGRGARRVKGFFRWLHMWISLAIGLQVLAWLISGLVIAALDPAKVSGQQWARTMPHETAPIPSGPLLEPLELLPEHRQGALSITLEENRGHAVYRVRYAGAQALFDAASGTRVAVDENAARVLALNDFTGRGEVMSITPGQSPDRETRNHKGAYWRVDFSDVAHTSVYVSVASGDILERRNDYWRLHDFFWMLHIMDYGAREDFNNPLVISVALIAAWLGVSGVVLLFSSFRRRDFRWLSPRRPAG